MIIARSLSTSLVLALFLMPTIASATALVNINTADEATLDAELPGVGPTTAASIIANRPYASVEEISRADGIGEPGSSSYEKIINLITVGATTSDAPAGDAQSAATTTPTTDQAAGAATHGSSYVHTPPPALMIDIGGDRPATVHTPLAFTAAVATPAGAPDTAARVSWAFGDGASAEGYAVQTSYDYPGTYLVAAKALDGSAAAYAKVAVTVANASVAITSLSDTGISIENEGANDLDLSGWMLVEGAKNFRIPEGTWVAPGATALFPASATKLAWSGEAILAYPDGSIASTYPTARPTAQPAALVAGYREVQGVDTALISPNEDDNAIAPPAGNETGGAALDASSTAAADAPPGAAGFLHSRYALGALAFVALAGGAFLIL